MEAILIDSIKKIRKASSRKHTALRKACDSTSDELQKARYLGFGFERYWEVFELAFNAASNDVTEVALESLFRLVNDGFVKSGTTVARQGRVVDLSDVMIQVVCDAKLVTDTARNWSSKLLLACVASPVIETHGEILLKALRVLRGSALEGKAVTTKSSAKAALQDVLNGTFARMEAEDAQRKALADSLSSPSAAVAPPQPAMAIAATEALQKRLPPAPSSAPASVSPRSPSPSRGPEARSGSSVTPEGPAVAGTRAGSFSRRPLADSDPAIYPEVMLALAFEKSSVDVVDDDQSVANDVLEDAITSGVEAINIELPDDGSCSEEKEFAFPAVQHRDAWVCLMEFCTPTEDLATTLLRLELLLALLEKSGPAFRSGPAFVDCVRVRLCAELLKNCTSNVMPVVSLSLRIFVALTRNFKDYLKSEVEVFVTRIFLRILESENRSHEQKMLVLEVFYDLCTDARALVEIFLNYDCDLYAIDLFKRIVTSMAKVAKIQPRTGTNAADKIAREEESLRGLGLEGLAAVVASLHKAAQLDSQPEATATDTTTMQPETEQDLELLMQQLQPKAHHNQLGSPPLGESEHTPAVELASPPTSDPNQPPSPHSSFDLKQKLQQELDIGITKFNIKPDKGIAYLVSKGHLDGTDPRAVAAFFHTHVARLNKTVVGEYMGRGRDDNGGFCVAVLHAFVDLMSFKELVFDEAIRHYLSGFRLPGEAQKIDRIMEKFAERYCLDNPGVFPNPDTAFILAFSIIMLNTDLHNPAIREDRRMTKAGFIGNSRGICAGGTDLPDELLGSIYDRIAASPISLKEDDERRTKLGGKTGGGGAVGAGATGNLQEILGGAAAKRRARDEAFLKERDDMLKSGEAALQLRSTRRGSERYISTDHVLSLAEHVQPMFEVVWGPAIGAFSQVLETTEDPRTVALCIKGLKQGLRLSGSLDMVTARETFVNTMAKFTLLNTSREIRPKNILCIKTLLAIALTDGNLLRESWATLLNTTSLIARLQLSANGLANDDAFFKADPEPDTSKPAGSRLSRLQSSRAEWEWVSDLKRTFDSGAGGGPAAAAESKRLHDKKGAREPFEEANAEAVRREIDQLSIDRVYANSAQLDRESLRCFVQQLVEVSRNEIAAQPAPRVFSLQRLVEVADYNMDIRNRIEWAAMWGDIAGHIAAVGCMPGNSSVAMYAIDCLRQLALKFLTKEELRDFNFQRAFLGPFEDIMRRSATAPIRELVVRCLDNVIAARANNIRSGWKTVLTVLTVAARDQEEQIVHLACGVIDSLITEHFALVQYDNLDLVVCLLALTQAPYLDVALSCVGHLRICARALASGDVDVPRQRHTQSDPSHGLPAMLQQLLKEAEASSAPQSVPQEVPIALQRARLQLWWPLLVGLAECLGDSRMDVRSAAISTLRDILRDYTSKPEFRVAWTAIFPCIMFPPMRHAASDKTATPQLSSILPTQGNDFPLHMESWIATTVPQLFQTVVEVYVKNMATAPECAACLPQILEFLAYYVGQDVEITARLAVQALDQLIDGLNGASLSVSMWALLCSTVDRCLRDNLPVAYGSLQLAAEGDDSRGSAYPTWSAATMAPAAALPQFNHKPAMKKLVVVLRLQHLIYNIIRLHASFLGSDQFHILLQSLQEGFHYARRFNMALNVRKQLHLVGFMRQSNPARARQMPHLLDQETDACRYFFATAFWLYGVSLDLSDFLPSVNSSEQMNGSSRSRTPKHTSTPAAALPQQSADLGDAWDRTTFAGGLLKEELAPLLQLYHSADLAVQRHRLEAVSHQQGGVEPPAPAGGEAAVDLLGTMETEVSYLTPLVLQALQGLSDMSQEQFTYHLPWLYHPLRNLIVVRSTDVRILVKDIFLIVANLVPALDRAEQDRPQK